MVCSSVGCAEKYFVAITIATQCKLSAKLMSLRPPDAFWFNRFSSARYNEKNNCRVVIYIMNKYINIFTPKFYLRAFAVKERRNKSNKIYIQVNSSFKVCLITFLKIINVLKIKEKVLH